MRKLILENQLAYNKTDDTSIITKKFEFEIITPMFGGDSKSWELNIKAPVRAQSIKGQLRFWWRTMQFIDKKEELLEKENRLWGGKISETQSVQSRVKLSIIHKENEIKSQKAELNEKETAIKNEIIPAYLAFPITSELKGGKVIEYVTEVNFILQLIFPVEFENEILDTLKLWTLFGGVGARTRRGCGGLFCKELLENFNDENSIGVFIKRFNKNGLQLPYSRLDNAKFAVNMVNTKPSPEKAWFDLISSYSSFRQDRTKKENSNRPGRSFWPEPDAIRTVLKKHATLHSPEHPDGVWFPRAAFGLPIITKFNTSGNGNGDPSEQIQLQPDIDTGDRWPSPVIIKVIRLVNGNVYKVAIVLNQSFPAKLILKQNKETYRLEESASPFSKESNNKKMKTNRNLADGESIYQALFTALDLKEVL